MSANRFAAYGLIAVALPLLAIGFIWGGFLDTLITLAITGTILAVVSSLVLRYKGTQVFGRQKSVRRNVLELLALFAFLLAFGLVLDGADGAGHSGALVFGLGVGYLVRERSLESAPGAPSPQ